MGLWGPLPEHEKWARTRACVVLLLGMYGATQTALPEAGWAWAVGWALASVTGYLAHRRVGCALYWCIMLCANPMAQQAVQSLWGVSYGPAVPLPQGFILLALVYGLTRTMGFGGRFPPRAAAATRGPVPPL